MARNSADFYWQAGNNTGWQTGGLTPRTDMSHFEMRSFLHGLTWNQISIPALLRGSGFGRQRMFPSLIHRVFWPPGPRPTFADQVTEDPRLLSVGGSPDAGSLGAWKIKADRGPGGQAEGRPGENGADQDQTSIRTRRAYRPSQVGASRAVRPRERSTAFGGRWPRNRARGTTRWWLRRPSAGSPRRQAPGVHGTGRADADAMFQDRHRPPCKPPYGHRASINVGCPFMRLIQRMAGTRTDTLPRVAEGRMAEERAEAGW